MATQFLNLPVNIPWKLVAASPDMMALRPTGDADSGGMPLNHWRSSLAIYAYEPKLEDLDEALCDQRITFLKVTCSITGYQPSDDEFLAAMKNYSDGFVFDYEQAIGNYFACYGVLLNVSVFPGSVSSLADHQDLPPLKDYPHIIDFEPKTRDLYQAATEAGEILTASKSGVQTDKSFTTTQTTSTGVNMGAIVPLEKVNANAGLTQNWGENDQDNRRTMIDSSRERRETAGTTTNLTQMYNLLTGYHSGTNRAAFLMLPRPHQQATEHRTFAQGLRVIEGVQDFLLIVSRPATEESICIQASLETGHILDTPIESADEDDDYIEEDPPYVIEVGPLTVSNRQHLVTGIISNFQRLLGGTGKTETRNIDEKYPGLEKDGWKLDYSKGDAGHRPVEQVILNSQNVDADEGEVAFDNVSEWNQDELMNYKYYVIDDTLLVEGVIIHNKVDPGNRPQTRVFHRKYKIYRKRQKSPSEKYQGEKENLLITHRSLSVCIKDAGDCLKVVEDPRLIHFGIVDETIISARTGIAQQIQSKMTGSASGLTRRPAGIGSFIDTDFFKDRIRKLLPEDTLKKPLAEVPDLPEKVVEKLGRETPVADLLDMDLPSFARKAGVTMEEAARVRRRMLGLPPAKVTKPTVTDEQAHKPGEDAK